LPRFAARIWGKRTVMAEFKPVCPYCRHCYRQAKAGRAVNGNQRYQCQDCKRTYVRENRRFRYSPDLRLKAIELRSDGLTYRQIASLLDVNHQTIANWVAYVRDKKAI
jgi:transposase-like protein